MTTTSTAPEYWRTGQGSHRHLSFYCANTRRSLYTGDCTTIPADEVAAWTPCDACCTAEDVAKAEAEARAKADAMCPNRGVAKPQRMQSTCKDCGKLGTVNRSTGRLRAHKPAAA